MSVVQKINKDGASADGAAGTPKLYHRILSVKIKERLPNDLTEAPNPDGSSEKRQQFDAEPPMVIDPAKRYTATMVTSKGTIVIALDPLAAPKTVNNFVFLARYHYYDGIVFHRIIPGFVSRAATPRAPAGAAPATGSPTSCPSRAATRSARWPWPTRGPTPTAASSSSSPGPTAPACPPVTRCSARWSRAATSWQSIDADRRPSGTPKERIVIESVTIEEAD